MELWIFFNLLLSCFYFLAFLWCAYQLGCIVYYGHKKASYQGYFLMLCLGWTFLRFFFFLTFAQEWVSFEYDLRVSSTLYWIPVHIQFATFTLLVLFFAHVVHKDTWTRTKYFCYVPWVLLNIGLLAFLIVPPDATISVFGTQNAPRAMVSVAIFAILTIVLSYYGFTLSTMIRRQQVQLLASNISAPQIRALTIVMLVVFLSRIAFNLLMVFKSDDFSVVVVGGDEIDASVTFVLFWCWELTPIAAVTFLFRHIPNPRANDAGRTSLLTANAALYSNNAPGLFQNPNRYDDFEDCVGGDRANYGSPSYLYYYHQSSNSPVSNYGSSFPRLNVATSYESSSPSPSYN